MKNTVTLIKSKGVGIGAIAILAGLVLALGELTSLFTHLPTYEGGFNKVAGGDDTDNSLLSQFVYSL